MQRVKRKTNQSLDTEDLFDLEETESLGDKSHIDVSICQNVAQDKHNNLVHHSTSGTNNIPSEESIPISIDQETTQPTTATPHPPAAALNDYSPMGDTPSKLVEAEPRFQHPKLKKFMEQQGRTNWANSHRIDDTLPDFEVTPAGVRMIPPSAHGMAQSPPRYMGPNERPPSNATHNVKRPLDDGTSGRKTKRNKNHTDVQTAKPSLLVVLKLTRGKGVSDRQKMVQPQQPHVLINSVEADEIAVRHSSILASRCDTVASDLEAGDELESIQPLVLDQDPIRDVVEAAVDTAYDLNDTTSAHDDTGPTGQVDDAFKHSSMTSHKSHVAQQQQDSQVMAEFRKFWFGEAFEVVSEIITTSFNNPTPEELVAHILVPIIEHIGDQVPSKTFQNDPLLTLNDPHEQASAQFLDSDQQERIALQRNVEPLDTASQVKPIAGMSSSDNSSGSHASPSKPISEDRNMLSQPVGSRCCSAVATGSLGGAGKPDKDGLHSDEQLCKPSSALPSHGKYPEGNYVSEVTREADQNPTFDYSRLVRNIDLTILIDRNDGLKPEEIGIIGIEDILDSNDFFNAVRYEYGWLLGSDEEFSAAKVTEADGLSRKWLRTELSLRNASRRDRSWHRWLSELRVCYERERIDINMDLVAKVLVTRKNDAKS